MVGRLTKVMQDLDVSSRFKSCRCDGIVKKHFIYHTTATKSENSSSWFYKFHGKCIQTFVPNHRVVFAVPAFCKCRWIENNHVVHIFFIFQKVESIHSKTFVIFS